MISMSKQDKGLLGITYKELVQINEKGRQPTGM